ncbi:hypothetical protein [Yoonia sp. BS5-3]|uniref:Uncharacterized protein n=1 Tax=Yoonia phaeophyticola TaxID=3137369 RepID=A0ABZ2V8Y0_9RHOB
MSYIDNIPSARPILPNEMSQINANDIPLAEEVSNLGSQPFQPNEGRRPAGRLRQAGNRALSKASAFKDMVFSKFGRDHGDAQRLPKLKWKQLPEPNQQRVNALTERGPLEISQMLDATDTAGGLDQDILTMRHPKIELLQEQMKESKPFLAAMTRLKDMGVTLVFDGTGDTLGLGIRDRVFIDQDGTRKIKIATGTEESDAQFAKRVAEDALTVLASLQTSDFATTKAATYLGAIRQDLDAAEQ